ncbi:hypothetical protein HN803_00140, partial [candidate division WWE3 bacterium]|nr:hypothetical protein [candidate division WWE3 bacterium]
MASEIKTNSILHPAIHAAKKSCLEDRGNAYKKGLLEPWGVIPLTANVKGIRYSFSITPVVWHDDTLPYRRRLEGSAPSGSSPTDDTWPADVPTDVDLTKGKTITGNVNGLDKQGTVYTGKDSNDKPITYTVYNEFTDTGVTYNVKTWVYDGDTYQHQTREEGGELKGEDKTKYGDNVDGSETDWSERPSNSPILTSYAEIYEEQPNNIRWWFELDNIKKSFDEYINWDETAEDSRNLADEVLGDDLQDAVDAYLTDVGNSTKPADMSQDEWDQNIANINKAMGDTLNSSKADIGRYMDTLSESETILNDTEDIKSDTPAIEAVDYVRNGVAYVSDSVAALVNDTVNNSSGY